MCYHVTSDFCWIKKPNVDVIHYAVLLLGAVFTFFVRGQFQPSCTVQNMQFWLKSHFHLHILAVLCIYLCYHWMKVHTYDGSPGYYEPLMKVGLFCKGSLILEMFDGPDSFCCKWTIWFSMMNGYVWNHGVTGTWNQAAHGFGIE